MIRRLVLDAGHIVVGAATEVGERRSVVVVEIDVEEASRVGAQVRNDATPDLP
jgi:hypothetical protein